MAKVAIVTDSTACIPAERIKQYNITVLPLILHWGTETLLDGVDIQPAAFYERLAKATVMPSTSQAAPAVFEKAFRSLLDQGYDVLAPLLSGKLSGTMASAMQAKNEIGSDRIVLVDTLTTAMAMGFIVLEAARAIEQGASLAETAQVAERATSRSGVLLTVDTLEFLHRGGRIGGAQHLLGTALNLKPILEIADGRVESVEKIRTRSKAQARMLEIAARRIGDKPVRLAVLNANCEGDAQNIIENAKTKLNVLESYITPVSPVLGTHVGPGTTGITYLTAA